MYSDCRQEKLYRILGGNNKHLPITIEQLVLQYLVL